MSRTGPSRSLYPLLLPLLAIAAAGCAAPSDDAESAEDAVTTQSCGAPAGRLTILALPTEHDLDWTTPNTLIRSALRESSSEDALVRKGEAKVGHFIGHTHVELSCGDLSFPLTGQTGGGGEWQSIGDGFGALFRDFPGTLNEFPETHGRAVEDVRLRTASGHILRMSFDINRGMCQRLFDYYAEYKRRRAYEHFTPNSRPRRFEGGGCATFGASFLDVGGLMKRSEFTPLWVRSVVIGNRRFSDFLGKGSYPYGSDLLAKLTNGSVVSWPRGVPIPARTFGVVVPLGQALDSWQGLEDQPFAIPNVRLEAPIASAVPITLYDPQLMAHWIDKTWAIANGLPNAKRMGLPWTATMQGRSREIIANATCVQPPSTPFDGDRDNLFEDAE
jgi:hypothetical protein